MSKTVITTASGSLVDYLKPSNINLEDIALGLSRQPRYAGQTNKSYSVAQHCLLVAELAPTQRAYALIHDAQEALLCDIPTPAKEAMRSFGEPSPYDELERRLHAAICKRLGLQVKYPITVKLADQQAFEIESPALHPALKGKGKVSPLLAEILTLPDGGRWRWLREVEKIGRYTKALAA